MEVGVEAGLVIGEGVALWTQVEPHTQSVNKIHVSRLCSLNCMEDIYSHKLIIKLCQICINGRAKSNIGNRLIKSATS